MSQFFIKTTKVGLLAVLPLFLISNYKVDVSLGNPDVLEGKYTLNSKGVENTVLKGKVVFETSVKGTNIGIPFSTLVLKLENDGEACPHTMEFLISKQDSPHGIAVGKYTVAQDIEGFIDSFDGIFGHANFKALGELPFFTEQGTITISDLHDSFLQGFLDITMYDPEGREITISGNFMAKRS